MDIKLVNSSGDYKAIRGILEDSSDKEQVIQNLKQFSQICARTCYSAEDFEDIRNEDYRPKFVQGLFDSGHHSVFEHINLTFNMRRIPKLLVMIFNNEKQYATSEKSARYTQMQEINPFQKEKYDKWMEILIPEIDAVYPLRVEKKDAAIKKLAQENARYMTSVFTPTVMVHTLNWRQLNFIMSKFEAIKRGEHLVCSQDLENKLIPFMNEFCQQVSALRVQGLENQTDRRLSLFNPREVEEHFGDTYSTSYLLSFAGLAQAHRHRTVNYHVSNGTELGAPLGFFVPAIIEEKASLIDEWNQDLEEIAENTFPQAQLLQVNERGILEDFRSKALLRICGHAQFEIMKQTTETAERYEQYQEEYIDSVRPKCLQGIDCNSRCDWRGEKATKRKI